MNAIISKGDKTAHVQLPVERKQLAGALSYLGANHTSDYDLKYNEENKDGLKVSLECFGVVENAIAKALPVGFRFHTLNESLTLMGNLPYQNRREVENTIKVDGLDSYEQLNRMLTEAYPQSITTKYYCPLTIQVHSRDCYRYVVKDNYILVNDDPLRRISKANFEKALEIVNPTPSKINLRGQSYIYGIITDNRIL